MKSFLFYYYMERMSILLIKIKIKLQRLRNYEEMGECLEETKRECYNVTELLRLDLREE